MSKYIAVITRADITRAALVEAGGRSMEQVKAACGCQYIINSWFYDTTTGKAVGNLKINGSVKASAGWNGWGLTWDKGADIRLDIVPDNGGASYLSGVELLTPTRGPGKALSYSPEYGGTRGRSAVLLAGARVRVERAALEYRRYRRTAPLGIYQKCAGLERRLREMGICVAGTGGR